MFESGEMYLETILNISEKKGNVRAVDIIEELGYSKSSVSRGVHLLEKGGYITIDENSFICLTKSGLEDGKKIQEKHKVLTDCLIKIGISRDLAEKDACKIEHVISQETFDAIKNIERKL